MADRRELGGISLTAEGTKLAAVELADIVRQRLAEFTPVDSGYRAVIFTYTTRTWNLLVQLAEAAGLDIAEISKKVHEEHERAVANGLWIDMSVATSGEPDC
jgi:predicted RNA-binding protein associated with RNAse of E/G family